MQMRGHAGDATGKNFAALSDEFLQEIGIFVINRLDSDVDPAAWHRAVRPSKSRTAFGSLGFHGELFRFAVQSMPLQERIVFPFLKPIGRPRTFLVPRGHIARRRFAERLRLSALECDNFLRHSRYSFTSAGAAVSSSSASPPSSSVSPKSDVTDWRTREALFCFSSCDWHWTAKRARGIASSRASGAVLAH